MNSRRDVIRTAGVHIRRPAPELPRVKSRRHRKFGTSRDTTTDKAAGLTTARLVEYGVSFTLDAEEPLSSGRVQHDQTFRCSRNSTHSRMLGSVQACTHSSPGWIYPNSVRHTPIPVNDHFDSTGKHPRVHPPVHQCPHASFRARMHARIQ